MHDDVAFYATPGPMTHVIGLDEATAGMPADPASIAASVQGVVLHPFWAQAYGVELPPDREVDVQIRPASAMIRRILELDPRPLVARRAPDRRVVGNCRHFSTLTVALLRRVGIPSRARCGFAGYFEPGRWVDHWVVEYWDNGRWIMLDAQVDDLQRDAVGFADDPTDLPPGRFLPAGAAWLRCQAGQEDGDRFGILDLWGQWFIPGNIARDLAALNKVEMLPWDGWGELAGADPPPRGDPYVDEIAALTVSNDHAAIRRRYETDDSLRVPPRVTRFFPGPSIEVDVPELA